MKITLLKTLMVISFFVMITMNVLANTLPLNNQTTGDISSKYPSFFTPAGITFSIWGIIYIFLTIYVGRMLFLSNTSISGSFHISLMIVFIASSVLNTLWLLTWHYDRILLSTIVMLLLLITLGIGFTIIPSVEGLTRTTFSLYFGWISIATIANITILLVRYNFNGFGLSEAFWLVLILIVGLILLGTVLYRTNDVIYGIVFIWAYFGIFFRHYTQEDLAEPHPFLSFYTLLMTLVIVGLTAYTYFVNNFKFFKD